MRGPECCEICCGSGRVRLPIYRLAFAAPIDEAPTFQESARVYPCPECGEVIPQDRLAIIQVNASADSRHEGDPDYMRMVKNRTAHSLVDELLKGGFIRVERGPINYREQFQTRATLAVVSQAQVATMEQRIAERQDQVAREMVAVAVEDSRNWGSYYTGRDGSIQKSRVLDFLREALKGALAKRKAFTPL